MCAVKGIHFSLDRLRVTVKMVQGKAVANAFRHNLDLYNSLQVEQLVEKAAETLEAGTVEIRRVVMNLTTALEIYRTGRLETMKPKAPEKKELTASERKAAASFLVAPGLLERTAGALARSGIIGEETNSMVAYLVYTSRKRETPLQLMYLGESGSGKTWLQEKWRLLYR